MKNLCLAIVLFFFKPLFSQVGIGTTKPLGTLEVVGRNLVEHYLVDKTNVNNSEKDYLLMVRSKETTPVGKVKLLDISLRDVAPVNRYNVIIKNVNKDQVLGLNAGLDASKYVVAITGAVFKVAESAQNSDGSYGTYSTEITKITQGTKTFNAINLDFKGANSTVSSTNTNGTWEITLVVYERSLVKDWGTLSGHVSETATPIYSGVSAYTPDGLK